MILSSSCALDSSSATVLATGAWGEEVEAERAAAAAGGTEELAAGASSDGFTPETTNTVTLMRNLPSSVASSSDCSQLAASS